MGRYMKKSRFASLNGAVLATLDPLSSWIYTCREAAGCTQAQFAERFGVRKLTIARWETGKHPLELQAIWRFCRAFPLPDEQYLLPFQDFLAQTARKYRLSSADLVLHLRLRKDGAPTSTHLLFYRITQEYFKHTQPGGGIDPTIAISGETAPGFLS